VVHPTPGGLNFDSGGLSVACGLRVQVPLGMKSWGTFHIVNDGYDNLELRFRLPADETHLPISIDFPEVRLGYP